MTSPLNHHSDCLQAYSDAWGPVSAPERRRLIEASLHADCVYADPNVRCRGHDELIAYMEGLQATLPGAHFVLDGVQQHHDQALWHWRMLDRAGETLNPGISAGAFCNGKLTRMTGFFAAEPRS